MCGPPFEKSIAPIDPLLRERMRTPEPAFTATRGPHPVRSELARDVVLRTDPLDVEQHVPFVSRAFVFRVRWASIVPPGRCVKPNQGRRDNAAKQFEPLQQGDSTGFEFGKCASRAGNCGGQPLYAIRKTAKTGACGSSPGGISLVARLLAMLKYVAAIRGGEGAENHATPRSPSKRRPRLTKNGTRRRSESADPSSTSKATPAIRIRKSGATL